MTKYKSPKLEILKFDSAEKVQGISEPDSELSMLGVLAVVQTAYSDIGMLPERMASVKMLLLELAARGEVEHLIYRAIVDSHPSA